MITNRKELLEALKKVQLAVGKTDNNMQQDHIVVSDNMLIAYNDEVAICHDLPQTLVGIGKFAVPAKSLIALLEKLSVEEVDIELTDDRLCVKGGRSKSNFAIQSEIKMPIDDICKFPNKYEKLPKKFIYALQQTEMACGHDMTKPLTTCVYLDGNYAVATNNYQCARYAFGDKFKWSESVFIPRANVQTISKIGNLEKYAITDGWIYFVDADNNMTVICRTYYKGQPFADIAVLFEADGETIQIPQKMQSALERAGLFITEENGTTENSYVHIELQENKITVTGKSAIGEYVENMRIKYNGPPKWFYIRSGILKQVIQKNLTCKLCPNFIHIIDDNYDFFSSYLK